MLTVYIKSPCRHSAKVLDALERLEIPFEKKDIADPEVARELMEKGGKRQVPFLDDDDPGELAKEHTPSLFDGEVEMYEADEIVEYLEEKAEELKNDANKNLHREDDSNNCESCE